MNIQPITKKNSLAPSSRSCQECNLQSVQSPMRGLIEIAALCFALLFSEQAFCQAGPVPSQRAGGRAKQATCVILKRTGTVDQVTSRVLSFGIRGKHFQYVEGELPEGYPFHDTLTEHDVRNLQVRGSEIVVLNSDFMPDELQQAREDCRAEIRTRTPIQADTAHIEIASNPPGTDIELDGKFIGSTPSSVKVASGEHTVKLTKNGYTTWERRVTALPGSMRISPELQPLAP